MLITPLAIVEIQRAAEEARQRAIIALVTKLACFLGRFNRKRFTYTWEHKGLFVVVNKEHGYTIAMYQHVVVLSDLFPDDPVFIEGYWLDLVNNLHTQIKQAKQTREQAAIGPLCEVA